MAKVITKVFISQEERDALLKANLIIKDICNLCSCDECPLNDVCTSFNENTDSCFNSFIEDIADKLTVEGSPEKPTDYKRNSNCCHSMF